MCSRCAALRAAEDASRGIDRRRIEAETRRHKSRDKKEKKKKLKVALQWALLAACMAVMAVQAPRVLSMFEKEKPIRNGTYATTENTDKCIQNLWRIARRLQEGKRPGTDLVCPETGASYVAKTVEDDIVVICPNPQAHGFSEISISGKNPVPRLVR